MQKGDRKKEKERKTQTKEKSTKREKRIVSITKEKRSLCQLQTFNIRESESFYYQKVNPVLYTHALQIILFGPFYARTQHYYGSLPIVPLQLDTISLRVLSKRNSFNSPSKSRWKILFVYLFQFKKIHLELSRLIITTHCIRKENQQFPLWVSFYQERKSIFLMEIHSIYTKVL